MTGKTTKRYQDLFTEDNLVKKLLLIFVKWDWNLSTEVCTEHPTTVQFKTLLTTYLGLRFYGYFLG